MKTNLKNVGIISLLAISLAVSGCSTGKQDDKEVRFRAKKAVNPKASQRVKTVQAIHKAV